MNGSKRDTSTMAEVSRHLGGGLTWVLSTMLFLWLGRVADGRLGTGPWLALIGAFVGASAGLYAMIRQLTKPASGEGSQGGGDEGNERADDGGSGQDPS